MMGRTAIAGVVCLFVGTAIGAASVRQAERRSSVASPPAPAETDIGYCQDMAAHHAQAVLMASMVRGRAGPTVAALAAQIELVQTNEIGMLNGLLAAWGQPFLSSAPMRWMSMTGMAMPGMATTAELASLQAARGSAEVDAIFLRLMLRHHQGGVAMDTAALHDARLAVVRRLAEADINDEVGEIAFMRRMETTAPETPVTGHS